MTYHFGTYVAGSWQRRGGSDFVTVNPASPGEIVGVYDATDAVALDAVFASARRAQAEWRDVPGIRRQAILEDWLNAVEARCEDIALAITLEMGKTLADARGEILYALKEARFTIGEASRAIGEVMPSARPGLRNMTLRRPRGVVVAATPWNYPVLTPLRKLAPAFAHGNAVILKPSETAPASACLMAEIADAYLPRGLFQIVLGGAAVGAALVSHAEADAVTFTGSVETGRRIYVAAAANLAEVQLELGGKNGIVVHDTEDLEACADEIVAGTLENGGQRCTSISRLIVRREIAADLERAITERMDAIVVGDGRDPAVGMGPMASAAHFERVHSMMARGAGEGARRATGEGQHQGGGFFLRPTLFADVRPEMFLAQQEVFGPVLSLISYDTVDEALAILNGVEFGLAAALFSNRLDVVQRFIAEAEAGMLHVNHQTGVDPNMPFVGVKNSGVGAASIGRSSIHFYTTEHSVYIKS
ncbi:aldehyde dehydrogenase [Kaistia algarum]|uniref:aldehyde dehydrogenase family protein n=1 Tax=Kaistia algarum TaxID=2083279 RepID=UPI000CE80B03|nr:aldehyde dehydrogenase family protein [Kaistia algarum]MCX5515338.1 aldehyde dehydrogenase family protein [Kaistia algarum]PPE77864.1 aldehyde dehydrogenase [Kaistia algarum]